MIYFYSYKFQYFNIGFHYNEHRKIYLLHIMPEEDLPDPLPCVKDGEETNEEDDLSLAFLPFGPSKLVFTKVTS